MNVDIVAKKSSLIVIKNISHCLLVTYELFHKKKFFTSGVNGAKGHIIPAVIFIRNKCWSFLTFWFF